ncbi:LysR substrate-binding domain-containing protein [Thalassotalea sp. Y01]|uniref:LysR substrate-binding domain-containing protein n=1 Tax=Thalassotalea sp. Y01 TaxID=2729613 RepID=UPI00145EDE2C|nr:LysR substrate-binding domain-containing protein [Thalassotalea sp. Y01]NMP16122.1 LysR family transcriptional regulator [Thalassotalea sp. Y01]
MANNLRHIDLNLLNILAALLSEPSLTAAAKKLNMSQPAVSMALQRLRTLYDDPLFVRDGRTLKATAKARQLGAEINGALDIIENTLPNKQLFDPASSKVNFKLNAFSFAEQLFAPKLLVSLAAQAPKCTLTVTTDYQQNPLDLMRNRDIDLHLNYQHVDHSDFHCQLVESDPMLVVARKGHPRFADKSEISMQDFLQEQHAVYTSGFNLDVFNQVFIKEMVAGFKERDIVYYGSSEVTAMSLIATTDVITILPQSLVLLLADVFPVKAFQPPFPCNPLTTYLTWHVSREYEYQHRWFREFVIEQSVRLLEQLKQAPQ